MQDLAAKLGGLLRGGEVIELVGDVGAGKTTFVRGLAGGMGITEPIQSPSFTINRVYDAQNGIKLVHYDFYRLNDPGIMSDELTETLEDEKAVVVVEWADSVIDVLPQDRLVLNILANGETSRVLQFIAKGEAAQVLIGAMQ